MLIPMRGIHPHFSYLFTNFLHVEHEYLSSLLREGEGGFTSERSLLGAVGAEAEGHHDQLVKGSKGGPDRHDVVELRAPSG